METQLDNSSRELAKGKIMGLAITVFGNEIYDLVPDGLNRAKIYDEASLLLVDANSDFETNVQKIIYNNLSPQMAAAYDKAKYWAIVFTQDLNYPLTTGQVMRAFQRKEDLLIPDDVDVDFIVTTLEEVGFDLSGWNGTSVSNQDEIIVLPETRLNANFSEPLPKKTSQAFPGYDVIPDNREYGMIP